MTKKVLIKKPRTTEVDGRRITLSRFQKHLVDDSKDFSTEYGIIKKDDLKKDKVKVGKETYYIFNADFFDKYKKIKRLAQIITLKDIGCIIANTGLNKDSKVLNAGTGSGAVDCFLGMVVKKVVSCDVRQEHLNVAKKNVEELGVENVDFRKADVYKESSFKQKDFDVFILDVPEPWQAVKTADKVLKKGGFLVSYSPNINQTSQLVNSLSESFIHEKTVEIIEREWSVKGKVLRPKMKDIGHTAFLTFARKIKNL